MSAVGPPAEVLSTEALRTYLLARGLDCGDVFDRVSTDRDLSRLSCQAKPVGGVGRRPGHTMVFEFAWSTAARGA